MRLPWILVFAASGCAEPFSVERHVLGPPRLAALGVHDGVARAAVWSGDGPWHAVSPELTWTLDGNALGSGFEVVVPGPGRLGVTVSTSDHPELSGEVSVGEWPGLSVVRQVVERPSDLSIDGRLAVTGPQPLTGAAASNQLVRLTAVRDDDGEHTTRWMLGSADWSILELDRQSADVVAASVVFDDGEVEEVIDGPAGLAPALVLSLDGSGGNAWQWVDVAFELDDSLLPVQGRLLPVSPDTATAAVLEATTSGLPHVLATLTATPTGLTITDVEEGTDLRADLAAFPSPDCAPEGSFPLWAVAEGRCALPDVDGVRVVLERER